MIAAKNYIAALNDAIEMAKMIIDLIEFYVDFETLAQHLLRQNMEPITLETLPSVQENLHITLVNVGDNVVIANNQIWGTQELAEDRLSKLAKKVTFEIREGSPIEKNYWWLQYHHWGKDRIQYA